MSLLWLTTVAWVRSMGKFSGAALLGLTLLMLPGCGSSSSSNKPIATKPCTLNSDCSADLVCSFGLCHSQCKATMDCPAGQRCVSDNDVNVCQLPVETTCNFNSDCKDPLVCAVDRQCRDQCKADRDCVTGQICAQTGVCAETSEVNSSGMLKGAVDGGSGGSGGSGGMGEAGAAGDANGGAAGATGNCTEGDACVPDAAPCNAGTISCASGSPVCTDTGKAADDGTACGTDKVCSSGTCTACKVGSDCLPDPKNSCATGKMACSGGPACVSNGDAADGTNCGTNKVCSGGTCTACKEGDTCIPTDTCKAGTLSCSAGPDCVAGGKLPAGSTCDTGKVCDSTGACLACIQDGACSPAGADCHQGKQDCSKGPNCADLGTNAQDGIACGGSGSNQFCSAGTCQACSPYTACVPTNACHKGTLNCGTSPPTCNDSQTNVPDGTTCGDTQSCIQGVCSNNDRVLTVTAGANGTFPIDSAFTPVTVHLVDSSNAIVKGAAITVTASTGAYGVAAATTDVSGNAKVSGRVGRQPGQDYIFTVSAPGATPITFKETSSAVAAKTILTLENVTHASGNVTLPLSLPATTAQTYYQIYAVTSAKDGTLYFAEYCNVYSLSPLGQMTRIAGKGGTNCGSTLGDGGPGINAQLYYVTSLALDENAGSAGILYIGDGYNARIREVDLSTGYIDTYAGGGANSTPWGDGGPATQAYLSPQALSVAPNGDLYVSDSNINRIRKIDASTGNITTYLNTSSCSAGKIALYSCGSYGDACNAAWDAAGHMFIAGYFCGGGITGQPQSVVRVEQDGTFTLVAGGANAGGVGENQPAANVQFTSTPAIAFDAAGNLFATVRNAHKLFRIDAVSTKITTVAGDGTASANAAAVTDYVAATTTQLNYPTTLALDSAGNAYFADTANYSVRSVALVGSSTAGGTPKLAATAGTGQTVSVDAPFNVLQVKLTDSANVAIGGARINWTRVDPGSGFSGAAATNWGSSTTTTGTIGVGQGVAGISGRVGLAPGAYHFTATYTDLHGTSLTPVTFTVTATAPAAGTIFPVVNYVHTSAHTALPGPATFSQISYPGGVAFAKDSTMYFSDDCAVYMVTPKGEMSVIAGIPGQCGYSGDQGPAIGAKLYNPRGLALDEAAQLLYVADYSNAVIREVDVSASNGIIDTLAGGGTNTGQPPVDGIQGTKAYIGNPAAVSVDSKGLVYFADSAHNRFLVVDSSGTLKTWLAGNTSVCNSGLVLYSVPGNNGGFLVFDANGAYISGYFCGSETGNNYELGISYRTNAGVLTRIVGTNVANVTEGATALTTSLPDLGDFAVDATGNIVFTTYGNNRLRRIDKATLHVNTIAGNGTAGYALAADPALGEYEPATGVEVYYPYRVAFTPAGHIVFSDFYNYTVREIW